MSHVSNNSIPAEETCSVPSTSEIFFKWVSKRTEISLRIKDIASSCVYSRTDSQWFERTNVFCFIISSCTYSLSHWERWTTRGSKMLEWLQTERLWLIRIRFWTNRLNSKAKDRGILFHCVGMQGAQLNEKLFHFMRPIILLIVWFVL